MTGIDFDGITSRNRKMQDLIGLARRAAASRSGLLLTGAAGTGKTALARWVHRLGRPGCPFVTLQFGSGADVELLSALNEASGGTLVLEDIDHASLEEQRRLQTLLDGRSESSLPRLIATARREIRSMVRQEQFRQDLYYRLAVLSVEIPDLDSRREDLMDLASFYLEVHALLHGKGSMEFSPEAQDKLLSWNWPGNIRELENVVERAVALSNDRSVRADHVEFDDRPTVVHSGLGAGMSLSEVERRLILQTLELTAHNRTRAAQILGISIRTLRNKLNEYREAGVV